MSIDCIGNKEKNKRKNRTLGQAFQSLLGNSLCVYRLYMHINEVFTFLNLFLLFFGPENIFFFNWRLITLQYCSGFCHTLTRISLGYTCVPHPEPPSHLPPHPIPQGHPSATAGSTLSHALNLDWWSVSYMKIYLFDCAEPELQHEESSIFVVTYEIFHLWHVGSSLLTKEGTQAPCDGSRASSRWTTKGVFNEVFKNHNKCWSNWYLKWRSRSSCFITWT